MNDFRIKFTTVVTLLFSICSIVLFPAKSQIKFKGIPNIKNHSRKEYNASPFNWEAIQDLRGMIYIANNYYVMEFDGYNWRPIPLSNRSVARSFAMDDDGKIYVGGQNEFGFLAPNKSGEMEYVSLKNKIKGNQPSFEDVWKIYITPQGVAFCTLSGIFLYKNDQINFIKSSENRLDLSFYANGRLFSRVEGKGIHELKNGILTPVKGSETLPNNNIADIKTLRGSEMLIFTQKFGIYKFDGVDHFEKWNTKADFFFKQNKITSVASLPEGYALGSVHNGLLIIDKEGNPILHLNERKGLQTNDVQHVLKDNTDNLWLSTSNGIDYIELNSPFSFFNLKTGLDGSGFTSYIENKNIYLGTSTGLYVKAWKETSKGLMETPFTLVENSEGQVYNLQKINNTLIMSHHLGAYQIVGNKAIQRTDGGVWTFIPLKQSEEYILCGSYHGLWLFKIENQTLKPVQKIKGFDESSRIIEQDEEGNIWVAHGYKGVYKIRLKKDLTEVEKINFYHSKDDGLPSNLFINVYKINHDLVFTTEKGVYIYNKEEDKFIPYEAFNRLLGHTNLTSRLVEDKMGNIWFSSENKIGVLKKGFNGEYKEESNIFQKLRGKLIAGFEHFNIIDNNNIFLGTDEGFVHYDPSFSKHANTPFNVIFRKVEVTNAKDSLLFGGCFSENTSVALTQPDDKVIELPYTLNSLKFSYKALNFDESDKVTYQYKLEGESSGWSNWVLSTQKEFTNLHEGNYVFKVRAKNIYNTKSKVSSFKFTIAPPWYRTYWALSIYLLLTTGLLIAVWKVSKFEQQKAMKFKEAQHREEALKAEKEIIRLNNDKLAMELSHKNKELASSTIHIVRGVEAIQKINNKLIKIKSSIQEKEVQDEIEKLLGEVEKEINIESNWSQFEFHFNQIHQDFLLRLKQDYPQLTHIDLKLCAYLRLNLSSKEIAPLLNLSIRGIEASRYRVRKKMNLSPEINLTNFILNY